MRIRGFVLGVALLALVGWCMIQESIKQTRARYELAEIARRESEIGNSLEKLRAEEDSLRSPARLAALIKEKNLRLRFLGTAVPPGFDETAFRNRRPGAVLDEDFPRSERPVKMAAAGSWQGQ